MKAAEDRAAVRDEVITLLLAGHETTALALSWTWYLFAQHPEVDASSPPSCARSWADVRRR